MATVRTLAISLALLCASMSPAAFAGPLQCAAFRTRLETAIDGNGYQVAKPLWKDPQPLTGINAVDYSFDNVAGLSGHLTCEADGRFTAIEATAGIDAPDPQENGARVLRLKSLLAAAICAVEMDQSSLCVDQAERLFQTSVAGFKAAKQRGEKEPRGGEDTSLPRTKAIAAIDIEPGALDMTLRGDPTSGLPDLTRNR